MAVLGLPIALGALLPAHSLAVLELAADSLGEIAELAALVRPTGSHRHARGR
ncbi:MAG: hypothetical protein ACOX3S_01625 [Anaerolineae bacterium]